MADVRLDVLREGTIDGEAGVLSLGADLLESLPAVLAVEARVREPLDADAVTELHGRCLGVCADGDDDTDTLECDVQKSLENAEQTNAYLVSTDEWGLGWDGPVTLGCVEICVADTGAVELDEALSGRELRGLGDGPVGDDLEGAPAPLTTAALMVFGMT